MSKHRVRPLQVARAWTRDAAFWRDVASRTISGLLVALVGYIAAVTLGYLSRPSAAGVRVTLAVLAGVALAALIVFAVKKWLARQPKWVRTAALILLVLALFALASLDPPKVTY